MMIRKTLPPLNVVGQTIATFRQATTSYLRGSCIRCMSTGTHNRPLANFCLIGKPGSGKGTYGSLLSNSLKYHFVVMGDVLRHHVEMKTSYGIEIAECQREGRLVNDELVSDALISHLEALLKNRRDNDCGRDLDCEGAAFAQNLSNSSESNESKLGFILDGFPRTLQQAQATTLWPEPFRISFALNIDVPDSICCDKMLGRRKCKKCGESFNVSDVNTTDGFVMPPKLPYPFPCNRCDMDNDWEKRIDDTEDIMARRIAEFYEKSAPVSNFFQEREELVNFVPYNGVEDFGKMELLVKNKIKFNL